MKYDHATPIDHDILKILDISTATDGNNLKSMSLKKFYTSESKNHQNSRFTAPTWIFEKYIDIKYFESAKVHFFSTTYN